MDEVFKRIFKVDSLADLMKLDQEKLVQVLLYELFSEEQDHMFDSISDAKDRAKGINPMSNEYQLRVAEKRNILLDGESISSSTFCNREVEALLANKQTLKTDLAIKYLRQISARDAQILADHYHQTSKLLRIDHEDPNTWTEIMIKNLYKREKAVNSWDLDDFDFSYEEFKRKIFEDSQYRKLRIPTAGMESEDYNPWGL